MFTEEFWSRCCIVFTRVPMDKKGIRMRQKHGGQKTDDQRAMEYLKIVEDKFPQVKKGGLRYLFLDACFDGEDEDEEQAFDKAMEELYMILESKAEGLETSKVNDQVESEHGKLKRELEARRKDQEAFTKQLEEIDAKWKEAEKNRANDEAKYQQDIKKLEDDMKKMEQKGDQRRGGGFIADLAGAIFPPAAGLFRALDKLAG